MDEATPLQRIEQAWQSQYRGAAVSARTEGLAGRVGAGDASLSLRARIVEAFWRTRHSQGSEPAQLAAWAAECEAAQDWRYAAIAHFAHALSMETRPEHDLQVELRIVLHALAVCQRLPRPPEHDQTVYLNGIGAWHKALGHWPEALEFLFRAAELADREHEPGLAAIVHMNIGTVFFASGNLEDALEAFQQASQIAEQGGIDFLRNILASNVALSLLQLERAPQALAWIEPRLPPDPGSAQAQLLCSVAALAAAAAGRLHEAQDWAAHGLELCDASVRPAFVALAHLAQGRARLANGDVTGAWVSLRQAEEVAAQGGDDMFRLLVAEGLAAAAKQRGDGPESVRVLEQVMRWRESLAGSAARTHVAALRIRGHLAELAQERDRARMAQARAEAALAELRVTQSELVRAEQRATAGSLIAAMAHQINTPLGTALTAASTLAEARAELDQALAAGTLRRQALADFLKFSDASVELVIGNLRRLDQLGARFRRFATQPVARRFSLERAVASAAQLARERVPGTPADCIVWQLPDLQPCCDRDALVDLLVELLDNALRARREGDAPIAVAAQSEGGRLQLTVTDRGPGMPAAALALAREPYAQRIDLVHGLGLGWRIVHHLVHQVLGGTLKLQSTPQTGTCVTIDLPAGRRE